MFVRSAAIVSCNPLTVDRSTCTASDVLSPKRMRSTGMIAAKENNDSTVDSRLNSILSAIWVLYGGTNRRMSWRKFIYNFKFMIYDFRLAISDL